jgi:small multidrug resistance pump
VNAWLSLGGGILLEVFSTLGLRASDGFRNRRWIAPVAVGYIASFALVWLALRLGMPVGVAYGVWSACGVALVAILARVFFGESLTPLMVAGIVLIIVGVLTIELSGAGG